MIHLKYSFILIVTVQQAVVLRNEDVLMKNLHITVTKKGTVEITDTRGTVSFDIERVSIDFDNHSETSYEEHHFAEVVATYKAMQKATEILKA